MNRAAGEHMFRRACSAPGRKWRRSNYCIHLSARNLRHIKSVVKQSAAILVVRDGRGPNGIGDRYVDFRVDDHAKPVEELARILALKIKRPN